MRDWVDWHRAYDQPGSRLHRRLAVVQRRLAEALDRCSPGRIRLVSVCAGQSRDVLEVVPAHVRGREVVARLVELDERNVAIARARSEGIPGVEVVHGDASLSTAYEGMVPADVVLMCGVFGHASNEDIEGSIRFLPRLCSTGATVLWTRHRRPPDLTPAIRRWFAQTGFSETAFDADDTRFSVGTHRFEGQPLPFESGVRLFRFLDSV